MSKKVFVSGCFDMLHSGHIAFFREAASLGDLYVALGSDRTVYELKGRLPVNREDERLFMVKAVSCVRDAFISRGGGILDFEQELRSLVPDFLVVNEDGNIPAKRALCEELGIEYVVLRREPHSGLPRRSTTDLRLVEQMPYRIDLAGGWLDQPFVSQHYPGSVITISLLPTVEFNERSGFRRPLGKSAGVGQYRIAGLAGQGVSERGDRAHLPVGRGAGAGGARIGSRTQVRRSSRRFIAVSRPRVAPH